MGEAFKKIVTICHSEFINLKCVNMKKTKIEPLHLSVNIVICIVFGDLYPEEEKNSHKKT